jgi:hypothetical protein
MECCEAHGCGPMMHPWPHCTTQALSEHICEDGAAGTFYVPRLLLQAERQKKGKPRLHLRSGLVFEVKLQFYPHLPPALHTFSKR